MSRSISISLDILNNSLEAIKTSLKNKGISLPFTVKVSGVPTLIDRISTTPKTFTVTINLPSGMDRHGFSVRFKDPSASFTQETVDCARYSNTSQITVSLPAGKYDVYIGPYKGFVDFKVSQISVGTETTFDIPLPFCVFVFDNPTSVTGIALNYDGEGQFVKYLQLNKDELYIGVFSNPSTLNNPTVYYRNNKADVFRKCTLTGSTSFSEMKTRSPLEIPVCYINTSNDTYSMYYRPLNGKWGLSNL